MIDEKATLKALVRELNMQVRELEAAAELGDRNGSDTLRATFDKYRDNPVRGAGGGSLVMHSKDTWDEPGTLGSGTITILPQPTQAERDAEQEVEWRALFEAQ